MTHDEAWAIYRDSLDDDIQLSDEDQFLVDEALNLLFREAMPGDECIMAFNAALNYYRQGYKALALKYYEYGANYGDSLCNAEAGAMLFQGDGVPIDYEKAFYYLNSAHEKRWYQAADLLAEMYRKGLYVEKDVEKAEIIYGHYLKYKMQHKQ